MPGIPSKIKLPRRGGRLMAPVELALRSRQEFLAGYDATLSHGGVFCPTRRKAVKGATATVKVNLGRRQPPLLIAGRVVWRRPGRHLQKIRAGICVEFLPGEKAKIDYLLDLAKAGDTVRSRRRHERLPVEVPVNWHLPGAAAPARGVLRDIGRGGAFVKSTRPRPTTPRWCSSCPRRAPRWPWSSPPAWPGPPAWARKQGFGVEWRARDAGGGKRIRELVRRLTETAGSA